MHGCPADQGAFGALSHSGFPAVTLDRRAASVPTTRNCRQDCTSILCPETAAMNANRAIPCAWVFLLYACVVMGQEHGIKKGGVVPPSFAESFEVRVL